MREITIKRTDRRTCVCTARLSLRIGTDLATALSRAALAVPERVAADGAPRLYVPKRS